MTDPIHAYLETKNRCDEAFATLARLRSAVLKVGAALQSSPRDFCFSNVNVGLPGVLPKNSLDGMKWPSAEDIQRAIAACHQADSDVKIAWRAVPPSAHSGLQPPGDPWTSMSGQRR
jgi:hypothetical protein